MKKVAAPGLENRLTAVGTRCADHVTPLYPQKLLSCMRGTSNSQGYDQNTVRVTEMHKSWAPGKVNFIYWPLIFSYFTGV